MLKRFVVFFIGIIVVSFGISLTIKADLGAGSWDALNVGLSNTIGFTVGTWVFIVGIILMFVNAWLMQTKPDYLAIFTIFFVGVCIDFWLIIAFGNWDPNNLLLQVILFLIGMILLALGISIYLQAKFPAIPIDKLMIAIQKRTGLNMMISKTIGEVSAFILAFLFGGPIGVGTLLLTFLIGPLVQFFFPRVERTTKRFI
ncbi:membrane protein [Aquibacillus koreensis]|uniref:Membrane protein n=1 Tax=Aquibacillus koreensis TaxID=279446 RepID=A0A9X3WQY6_9BACI|nr:membrane protein [Aquibacillus koreensis]MCT2534422.1 membrane protein [Aquibacillus koreensis]MDC3421729.1 membrane protein [Aquibacillus koreensis]